MKYIISLLLIVLIPFLSQAQGFFKYSTFYISGSANTPLKEQPNYQINRVTGEYLDLTEVNPYNYNLTIGVRKIARFDYENRANVFYDGTENTISNKAPTGAVGGFDYLGNFSMVRNRGEEFMNHNYWVRYVHKHFLVKVNYEDNQDIELKHFGGEVRAKVSTGGFDFTVGAKHRTHPVYGYVPFEENFNLDEDPWWTIAYDLGYVDEYYYVDGEDNGVDDWYDYYNWNWYAPDGTWIAETDEEFMKYHFGRAINQYNKQTLRNIGLQQEMSAVLGIAYYHYTPKFWLHTWADVLPWHKGLTDYAYRNMVLDDRKEVDYDTGLIIGTKLSRKLGMFLEGSYQRYWGIENYRIKAGINFIIL